MRVKLGCLFVLLLAAGSSAARAGCVSCGPDGECFEAAPGFSANCECRIRSVNGMAICRPSGVCDATDSTSCGDDPLVGIPPGKVISTAFLPPLGDKHARLAGAVWGALVEEETSNPARIGPSHLAPGDYAGTMGSRGRSYTYQTHVQAEGDGFRVFVTIRQDGSGKTEEFEGTLSGDGRQGNLLRVQGEARSPVFHWDDSKPSR